ncbi:MAG: hypothetical protein Q8P97_02365, partial [bacterium]|nr:hypothetical protein [bacterium]
LTGFPVAYLITGISAFEVLPIYLMLYIFFALNIRLHGLGEVAAPAPAQKPAATSSRPGLISFTVMGGLLILAALSFYYADYRPYLKNRQLLKVAAAGNSADSQTVYDYFLKTLAYSSPIGQQETVQYFLLFVYRYLDANSQDKNLVAKKEQLLGLIAQADKIYAQNESSPNKAVGVKTLSYLGLIHLRAAVILQDSELLNSAQKIFEQGLIIAPTRFEFIYPLLDIAIVKSDRAMAKPLLALAKNLRPDLPRNAQYEQALSEATSTASTSPKIK